MKKIINWLLLVPMALMTASCLEEVEPTGYLTEGKKNALYRNDSQNLLAASLTGMYNNLISFVETDLSHNYFGQKSFDYLTSLMGNDMVMTGEYGMSIYHHLLDYWQHNYTPTANRWAEYYSCIKDANNILALIDPESEDSVDQYYRAVALSFRGYAYLQLTYLYQHSYYVGVEGTEWGTGETYDHSQKPCVPILLENTKGDQPRSTLAAVHERINEDLTDAFNIFEALGKTHTMETTDMDGTVVAMHLARQSMILNKWDDAIKYAEVVMENYPVLKSENDLLQGFSDKNLSDVVFAGDVTSDNTGIYASWFSQMDFYSDGYAGIGVWRVAFKPLVDRIADNDIRLQWFCCERSTGFEYTDEEGNSQTVTLVRDLDDAAVPAEYLAVKFIGTGRNNILSGRFEGWELGDYIYLRSEEAYLIYAEALAHKKEFTQAVNALTDFMKTRQPDYEYTFTDYAALVEEIIFQKRVEFWGEGMEFLDNRRLNIPVDRTDATWGENNNHLKSARLYAEQESKYFLYQLPDKEMENNTALTPADQN